jgi:hypothetical protein
MAVAVSGDRAIRAATAAVVLAVAGFAAIVSYSHIYDLGHAHGQSGTAALLLPLSVDGLIVAASLVMLHEARNQRDAPALARVMLALGVAATIAANVAYGATYGAVGAVISAWPAVAFVGSAELLMVVIRSTPRVPVGVPAQTRVSADVSEEDSLQAQAATAFADDLAAGRVPSIRAIRSYLHVGQPRAQQVRSHLAALAQLGSNQQPLGCKTRTV